MPVSTTSSTTSPGPGTGSGSSSSSSERSPCHTSAFTRLSTIRGLSTILVLPDEGAAAVEPRRRDVGRRRPDVETLVRGQAKPGRRIARDLEQQSPVCRRRPRQRVRRLLVHRVGDEVGLAEEAVQRVVVGRLLLELDALELREPGPEARPRLEVGRIEVRLPRHRRQDELAARLERHPGERYALRGERRARRREDDPRGLRLVERAEEEERAARREGEGPELVEGEAEHERQRFSARRRPGLAGRKRRRAAEVRAALAGGVREADRDRGGRGRAGRPVAPPELVAETRQVVEARLRLGRRRIDDLDDLLVVRRRGRLLAKGAERLVDLGADAGDAPEQLAEEPTPVVAAHQPPTQPDRRPYGSRCGGSSGRARRKSKSQPSSACSTWSR